MDNKKIFKTNHRGVNFGFYLISLIFSIQSIRLYINEDSKGAIIFAFMAIILPIASYISRSAKPSEILVDASSCSIYIVWRFFGFKKEKIISANEFDAIISYIGISRFPKNYVELKFKSDSSRFSLATFDIVGGKKFFSIEEKENPLAIELCTYISDCLSIEYINRSAKVINNQGK